MTSSQESSKVGSISASATDLESLAGLVHPHAIEVQDFSYYGLVIDVRSVTDFDEDHIPGAVCLSNTAFRTGGVATEPTSVERALDAGADSPLPTDLAALMAPVKFDQAILVYCGRGGRDSGPIAQALRWRGWTVDVLPGGWINYRRWVRAGLEALPRLIAFRIVTASLDGEVARFIGGLSRAGEQVLDVGAIAGLAAGAVAPKVRSRSTQAGFESRLLQALRQIDPRRPVWIGDVDLQRGDLRLPGAMTDALAVAPAAFLVCPQAERLASWREDDPHLREKFDEVLQDATAGSSSDDPAGSRAGQSRSDVEQRLTVLLATRDQLWRSQLKARGAERAELPALVTSSLAPDRLCSAIEAWLQLVQSAVRG